MKRAFIVIRTFVIMGLCALVALAATSCKKEAQTTSSFKATLTQPTSDAKTHLGSDSYLYWNTGDAIKVFDAEGNEYQFSTDDNNVTTATFNGTDPIDVNGSYTAFYPADVALKQGNDILLTLPATQDYAEGTFGNATYPMAALYNATTGFTFGSPCGLLAIPVKGTGNISSIELTSRTSGEVLAGQLRYNLSGEYQGLVGTETTVTLNCGNLELDATNATTFYFVLPAGVFANGFTAVLKNGTTELYTLEAKQTGVNTIAAQSIKLMTEVEVQAIGVTTDAATGISKTAATLNGSYELPTTQGMNVTEVGFYFGTDASAMTATQATLGTPFSLAKTGLTAGTTYYYKAYAKNGTREYEGPVMSFTTLSDPTVSTGAAAATSATTATGHVTLTNAGSGTVTELGLCWGTSDNPTVSNNHAVAAGQEVGTEYAINITGLTAGAQYYVRGYAKVGDEYYYGNSVSFIVTWNGNLSALTGSEPAGFATATNGMTIYGTLNAKVKVSIADGATVTLNNAIISYSSNGADYAGLTCLGDATIMLADGTSNTIVGGLDGDGYSNWPGIFVPQGSTLTINGNDGVLNAHRGGNDTDYGSPAGIGASWKNPCGNIVINGGVINAEGGAKSAGIGGTFIRTCGDITINGGTITATGHKWGVGIGLGGTENASATSLSGCNITITGGTVDATGGWGGAGIGTGFADHKSGGTMTITLGDILISGGNVTATGGVGAAGIGTGGTEGSNSNNCSNITITNGVTSVTATKGSSAPNSIGAGYNGTCGTITIGGTVYPSGATPNQSDGVTFIYPVTETTITWNSSYISSINHAPFVGDGTVSNSGITASFNWGAGLYDSGMQIWSSSEYQLTFSSTVGNISKIEISSDYVQNLPEGQGWSLDGSTVTWEGTPASSVTLSGNDGFDVDININGISQIVFTVQ